MEDALAARLDHLVERGFGRRHGHGVQLEPAAFDRLREADVRHALARDLPGGRPGHHEPLTHGWSDGVVIGEIATALGRMAVIDRTVGLAIAPIPKGVTLEIGREVGREVGRDLGHEHGR